MNLKLTDSVRLAGQQAPGIVCLYLIRIEIIDVCSNPGILCGLYKLGIQTQVPRLAQQTELSHLSAWL